MSVAFQLEIQTTAYGRREIISIECEPTQGDGEAGFVAEPIANGAWLLEFVLDDDFDGSEPVFGKLRRYGLDPETSYVACCEARQATAA
jgi:hypothetical protein